MKCKKDFYRYLAIRKNFFHNESNFRSLQILIRLNSLNLFEILNNTSKIKTKFSLTKVKNTCIITLRKSSIIIKRFKLSRIKLKEFGNNGLLPGLKKYSW